MRLVHVGPLPDAPLKAAAHFHQEALPRVEDVAALGGDLIIVFGPADHTHRAWRTAVVQELARAYAPIRINALAGEAEAVISAAAAYLAVAPGVTGQLLQLDGTGAGPMLYDGE